MGEEIGKRGEKGNFYLPEAEMLDINIKKRKKREKKALLIGSDRRE
jgi:hypothetical protein